MAVNKIDFPTGGAPIALQDYVDTLANIAGNITGKGYIPITNFGTTGTPQIAQSAIFSFGGVLYQADADTAISGSMAAESYIEMVPAGSPTGATLTPTWTATAPTWDTAYNHFVSASSNLVLNVMRDQDGYNSFIEGYDFINVSANSTTPLSMLGNFADMLKRHSVKGRWSAPSELAKTAITGNANATLCNLDENESYIVALISSGADDNIQTYQWNGASFAATGNAYTWNGTSGQFLARLSDTTIAATNGTTIRKLSFDGTDWTLVGNSFSYTGSAISQICELENNRIALFDQTDNTINTVEFDGSDWSITYTDSYTENDNVTMCKLGTNRIAIFGESTDDLSCLLFDGTNWAEIGTPLGVSAGELSISSLSNNHLIAYNAADDSFRVYYWSGSTFEQSGNFSASGLTFTSIAIPYGIAVMNGTDFVLYDIDTGGIDYLVCYRLGFSLSTVEIYD